jgi:hypothetical protein
MSRVEFVCPACHAAILAPQSLIGESAPCPKCGAEVDSWPGTQTSAAPSLNLSIPPLKELLRKHGSRHGVFSSRSWIYLLLASVAITTVLVVTWRAIASSDPTVGDVVSHFQRSGLKGSFQPQVINMLNAKEGGILVGKDFEIDIYRLEDESQAMSLEKTGFGGHDCHRRGKLILVIHQGDEQKILALFNRF